MLKVMIILVTAVSLFGYLSSERDVLKEYPELGISVIYQERYWTFASIALIDKQKNKLASKSIKPIDSELIIVSESEMNIIILSGYTDWVWQKKANGEWIFKQ